MFYEAQVPFLTRTRELYIWSAAVIESMRSFRAVPHLLQYKNMRIYDEVNKITEDARV